MRLSLQYIFLFALLCLFQNLFADGSKDFYPNSVQGNRAYLLSRPPEHNEFSNYGRHFAYAKIGETIAVASSAQGVQEGRTILYSPSGKIYSNLSNSIGKIVGLNGLSNRQAELAGPRDGYQAFEKIVDEEGIWKIEFVSPMGGAYRNADVLNIYADDNWQQRENENLIAAWDVSVRNKENTQWITGRVYANAINLHISSSTLSEMDRGFHGKNYVLTKDGYIYKVDGNGSVGLRFTYFVNNAGFLDQFGNPSYKSSNLGYSANISDPNMPDTDKYVTHKMFYTFPSNDLPKASIRDGSIEWLKNVIEIAEVKNIKFNGSEGLSQYVNTKGATISFETNFEGRYKVLIRSKNDQKTFTQKEIIVTAKSGLNELKWDGTDGLGKLVPEGQYDIEIAIASIEGEIHFPYFDMEINPNGILIERLNSDGSSAGPAIAYWDDSELTAGLASERSNPLTNLLGINSFENGHRWGTYSMSTGAGNGGFGAFSFGNDKAIDTWSYSVQIEEKSTKNIIVKVTDLEVVSVVPNKKKIELNETLEYVITIKNNGPSDAIGAQFEYNLPQGFNISNVSYKGVCGKIYNTQYNKNEFKSSIDLPNGCEVLLTLKTIANNVPNESYGLILAEAGVIRSRGYTDPDATNTSMNTNTPISARQECVSNCNNIKIDQTVMLLEPYNERGQIALEKTVKHIDSNGSGFQEVGEQLEYTFRLKNAGLVALHDIYLIDSLLSDNAIKLSNLVLNPNDEYVFSQRYTLKQTDVNAKVVHNSASVHAKNPRNFDVKDISGHTYLDDKRTSIDIDQRPNIYLKKEVVNIGTGENNQFTLGDEIIYKFTIRHTGDVAVHNLKLFDTLFSVKDYMINKSLLNNSTEYQLSYKITPSDISYGEVINTASIEGVDIKYGNRITDISGITFDDDIKTTVKTAKPYLPLKDQFDMYQGNITSFDVLKNDTKGSSTIQQNGIIISVNPEKGTIQIKNNLIIYTPLSNHLFGEDTFSYKIIDNSRLISEEVEVVLNIIKTKPIAVDDYYFINYNRITTVNPLENDYVEHSKIRPNSLRIVSHPQHGIIEVVNGKITYTPERTFTGIDEVQYVISDENDNFSEPATIKFETTGFFIPNVVTPNGDGLNDTFEIIGIYMFDKVDLQIFDRFGNSVYHSENYQNDWNIDSSIAEGTYYYLFKGTNNISKPLIRKGSFLINRTKLR